MNKIIAIIMVLAICFSIVACANSNEIDIPDFSNASEFPEIEWPTTGFSTVIPPVTWSNRGAIYSDVDGKYWAGVGYTTLENYEKYLAACQEMGYTIDAYNEPGSFYFALNEAGYGVQLVYHKHSYELAIYAIEDGSSRDRWWEND